jgi:uncharacterized membrane protein YkvA (DUF1232 family)
MVAAPTFDVAPVGRPFKWWFRQVVATIRRAARVWLAWLVQTAALFTVAIGASMLDVRLLAQWREHGWRVIREYVPLAAGVFLLTVLDRRADRLGHALLLAAVAYGVASQDILPDHRVNGWLDDIALIAVAARFFMWRCPGQLVEEHALQTQRWYQRTAEIRQARQQLRRRVRSKTVRRTQHPSPER